MYKNYSSVYWGGFQLLIEVKNKTYFFNKECRVRFGEVATSRGGEAIRPSPAAARGSFLVPR